MPKIFYPVVFCLLLLLSATPSEAQWLSLPFERITIEDGLPNPSVLDIIQDRQGFMWFGTLNGIVRYDGYRMTVYHPAAVERGSLPERDVPRLFQDKAGNIWVGLMYQKAKLFRYDDRSDNFIPYLFDPSKPADKQAITGAISTFAEDDLGRLLAGTWEGGLYVIEISKEKEGVAPSALPYKHFQHIPGDANSLASDYLHEEMAKDADGNIWIPTRGGLSKFSPGSDQFKTFHFPKDTSQEAKNCVTVFFEAPRTLWVGTGTEGLIKFDVPTETVVGQFKYQEGNPFSLADNWVSKIIRDKEGKFWLGVGGGNIDVFDPAAGKFFHVKDRHHASYGGNFPNNNALVCDYSGNIWAATWQSGIYKFNPDKGRFYFLRHDFYQKIKQGEYPITAILEDKKGNLWLGTEGDGLVCWDRKTDDYRHFRHQPANPNSLSSNEIESIAADAAGYLWAGTSAGLDRLNPANGAVRHYQPFPGKEALAWQSKKGDIWTMTSGMGLCRLLDKETGAFKRYLTRELDTIGGHDGFGGLVVIEEDESGKLWLGVNQWGFWVLDPETDSLTHYLSEYGVHDIHFDRHGQCWLATHSGGLKLWDRQAKRLIHLPKEEHDKIGIARNILEDEAGFLWMKTPTGVVQFDPLKKRVVRQYSARNWLNNADLWYGNKFSVPMKTRQGELFFTSPSGLLYFHPQEVNTDTVPPKIAFTSLRVLNEVVLPAENSLLPQHISQTQKIELEHWQNDFAFEFAALHFKSPEENEYSYFLENRDKEWRYAGRSRTAAYTNLDPGRYVFWVKAANSDGVWGESISIEVIVRSPWWAMWWAYILYFLTATAILLGIRRYELKRKLAQAEARRLEELDAVKTRLYTNITHEFRTPLTIILGFADQLKASASESMKTSLDMIRRNGQQLLRLVNQMLDLAKVESGHLKLNLVQGDVVNYLQYLLESFHSLAKSKNIRLHFQTKEENLVMDYDHERLQTVVSNLLSNAIKFTPNGGEVMLRVQITESPNPQILIQVSDTGPGIPEHKLPHIFDRFYQADPDSHRDARGAEGTGIGLTLTRELVKLMQGNINVQSVFGEGAEFKVVLPISRTAEKQAVSQGKTELERPSEPLPPEKPKMLPAEKSKENPLVLLVEDNPDVVRYLQTCLHDEYRLEVAYDGEQGIEKALELVPDLIISDVMMPRKDGFQVCHTLKTDERSSHIPIILLTARADIESRLTGLRRGADAYLAKPFHKEELLTHIRNLLEVRKKLHAHYLTLAGLQQGKTPSVQTLPEHAMEDAFIQKIRDLIEKDFSVQWQVTELADKLFVSTSQLHRKLEALTGMHTTEFVRHIRIAKASELLLAQPDEKIAAVAYDVGFENVNEFNRRFKEVFGATPGEWRKRER